jgi:hypothetical protein
MNVQQSGMFLGALMVSCVAVGCAASAGQVRARRPHARVLVRIEHGDPQLDDEYLDGFNLDGLHYSLVTGRPMLLRLAPGKHEVQLVSRRVDLRVDLTSFTEYASGCALPNCIDPPMTKRGDRLELAPSARSECVQTLTLDVKAGDDLQAALLASPDGTCRPRG